MLQPHLRNALFAGVLVSTAGFYGMVSAQTVAGSGAANDPIVITFPNPVTADGVAVEIDGIDVTSLAQFAGDTVTITPAPPLSGGSHEVIVYQISGGGFTILAQWDVTGSGNGSVVDSFALDASHVGGVRSGNDGTETFANSSGEVEISLYDGRITGGANYLATTIPDEQLTDNPVDLGEYYLQFQQTGEVLDITARVGHQSVDFDDLIVADFRSRGAGLTFESTNQRILFSTFGTQAVETLGVENISGLAKEDDRIFGGTLAIQPFGNNDFRLAVTGYAGRGTAFSGVDIGEGDGVSLEASGSVLNGRGRYTATFGQTNWDEDAEGAGFESERATALTSLIEYDVLGSDGADFSDRSLTLGFGYERVEDSFYSLGNPGLLPGMETFYFSTEFSSAAHYVLFEAYHETTNIAGPVDLETDRIITAGLSGTYTPFLNAIGPGWAGQDPLLSYGIEVQQQDRLDTPLGAIAQQDFFAATANLGFSTAYDQWSWGVGYALYYFDDHSAAALDETIHSIDASLEWYPTTSLTIAADTVLDHVSDPFGTHLDGFMELSASADIIEDKLSFAGSYSLEVSDGPSGINGGTLGADITWHFAPAADIVLSGGYTHGDYALMDDPEWFVGALLRVHTNILR